MTSEITNALFVCQEQFVRRVSRQFVGTIRSMERVAKVFSQAVNERYESVAAAARTLGYTNTKRLENYLKGSREPDLAEFAKLCLELKVNPGEALGLPILLDEDEYARVRVIDVSAAAGPGSVVSNERTKHQIAFRTDWLRVVSSAPADALAVIEADGDSMEPFIHDGDHMLVDTTQIDPRRDGIYVIEWGGFLNVKRVTANPASHTISISSDNPAYAPYHNVSPSDVRVIGRVIWVGRRT